MDQEKQQKTVEGKEIFPYFADSIIPNILNNLQNGTIPLFRSAGTSCTTFDDAKVGFLVILELFNLMPVSENPRPLVMIEIMGVKSK